MDFVQFAAERGLIIDNIIHGKWARTKTVDKPNKHNGSFWHGGDFAHVRNWATMDKCDTWFVNRPMLPHEKADMQKRMEASKQQYTQERSRMQHRAIGKANWILSQCELDKHAYLDSKGYSELLGNVWRKPESDPLLVIPMQLNGVIGCQLIDIQGKKKFLVGQRTSDSFFKFSNGSSGRIFLTEGYASALSLKSILDALKMHYTIYACFSAGNLARLAKTHPTAFVVADNDKSGTGQKVAEESKCKWWMPEQVGMDVNDLWKELGTFKASQLLRKIFI